MIARQISPRVSSFGIIAASLVLAACGTATKTSGMVDATPETLFEAFRTSEEYKFGTAQAKERAVNYLPNGCKDVRFLDEPPVVMIQEAPVKNPNFSELMDAKWRETYKAEACGKAVLQNVNYVLSATKNFQASLSAPGTSRTSLPVQARLIAPAARAALAKVPGATNCPPRLWNTEVQGGKAAPALNWTETWHFGVCKTSVTVDINIKANERGVTGFSIGSRSR